MQRGEPAWKGDRAMDALILLIGLLAGLIVFDILALLWGKDSRSDRRI